MISKRLLAMLQPPTEMIDRPILINCESQGRAHEGYHARKRPGVSSLHDRGADRAAFADELDDDGVVAGEDAIDAAPISVYSTTLCRGSSFSREIRGRIPGRSAARRPAAALRGPGLASVDPDP